MVKDGFKQTDLGEIPQDWNLVNLKNVCTLYNGRAYKRTEWETSGVPVIRLQNLTGGEDYYFSNLDLPSKQYCEDGDLLYMWSATFGPHIWKGPKAIFHYHIWRVEPVTDESNKLFLFYKLDEITQYKKSRAANGGTMLHVTKKSMEDTQIALPPLREQNAIAEALSDVDGLIAGLDKLIAKKRAVKQAAMQQLLTGKTRLPGFENGRWISLPLVDLLEMPATYGIVKAGDFQVQGVPMVRGGDIKNGKILLDLPLVTEEKSQEYSRTALRENDVVIALVGYPGESAKIPGNLSGANISRAVGLLRTTPKLLADFLVCYLNSPEGRRNFLTPSAGSAQLVVNLKDLNLLKIPTPPMDEQEAIATIFSDIDAEITALEARRAKTQAIKQGMMQELLTGRTRLL